MSGKLEFQGKLGWILEEAKEHGGRIRREDVEKYFEEDHLSEQQMELVYDYLLSQKVAVSGYERKFGKIVDAEEKELSVLTPEEERYLENYEQEIGACREKMGPWLEKVLDIARKLHDGSVFLGDLVQEGNVSLMLSMEETQDEEKILEAVETGIEAFLAEQKDVKIRDNKMVEKVDELEEQIRRLKEEMGRKITLEELALYTERSEAEIKAVLKLAGEEIQEEEK